MTGRDSGADPAGGQHRAECGVSSSPPPHGRKPGLGVPRSADGGVDGQPRPSARAPGKRLALDFSGIIFFSRGQPPRPSHPSVPANHPGHRRKRVELTGGPENGGFWVLRETGENGRSVSDENSCEPTTAGGPPPAVCCFVVSLLIPRSRERALPIFASPSRGLQGTFRDREIGKVFY